MVCALLYIIGGNGCLCRFLRHVFDLFRGVFSLLLMFLCGQVRGVQPSRRERGDDYERRPQRAALRRGCGNGHGGTNDRRPHQLHQQVIHID